MHKEFITIDVNVDGEFGTINTAPTTYSDIDRIIGRLNAAASDAFVKIHNVVVRKMDVVRLIVKEAEEVENESV